MFDVVIPKLPERTTETELYTAFVGVHRVTIKPARFGKQTTYAFVRFKSPEDASRAVKTPVQIRGRNLVMRPTARRDMDLPLSLLDIPTTMTREVPFFSPARLLRVSFFGVVLAAS